MPNSDAHEAFLEDLVRKRLDELKTAIPVGRKPQGTAIDGPSHYNGYEVLEAICNAEMARGFCLGNAVKYLLRAHRKKGGVRDKQDLEKAKFYLDWFLERYEQYQEQKGDGE